MSIDPLRRDSVVIGKLMKLTVSFCKFCGVNLFKIFIKFLQILNTNYINWLIHSQKSYTYNF